MTFREALIQASIAKRRGEIDNYRIVLDEERYRSIVATDIDGEVIVFFDEREWV